MALYSSGTVARITGVPLQSMARFGGRRTETAITRARAAALTWVFKHWMSKHWMSVCEKGEDEHLATVTGCVLHRAEWCRRNQLGRYTWESLLGLRLVLRRQKPTPSSPLIGNRATQMRIPLNEGNVLRELCLILAYVPAGLCFSMADTQSITPICRAVVRLVRDGLKRSFKAARSPFLSTLQKKGHTLLLR